MKPSSTLVVRLLKMILIQYDQGTKNILQYVNKNVYDSM